MDDETRATCRQLLADKTEGLIDTPEFKERKKQVFSERDARTRAELTRQFPQDNSAVDGCEEDGVRTRYVVAGIEGGHRSGIPEK